MGALARARAAQDERHRRQREGRDMLHQPRFALTSQQAPGRRHAVRRRVGRQRLGNGFLRLGDDLGWHIGEKARASGPKRPALASTSAHAVPIHIWTSSGSIARRAEARARQDAFDLRGIAERVLAGSSGPGHNSGGRNGAAAFIGTRLQDSPAAAASRRRPDRPEGFKAGAGW